MTATATKYEWTKLAESEGGTQAEKIPPGSRVKLKIIKVKHGNKDGKEFKSASGDPQVLIVFQDSFAREATSLYTLSDKAAWTLAKLMGCCDPSINLARMEADGVTPQRFAEEEFANKVLVTRQLEADITYKGDYANIVPLKPEKTAAAPSTQAESKTTTPAADDAPPEIPVDDVPPKIGRTEKEAWKDVTDAWAGRVATDKNNSVKRNNAWLAAIKATGKLKEKMTPEDWHDVAMKASDDTPF